MRSKYHLVSWGHINAWPNLNEKGCEYCENPGFSCVKGASNLQWRLRFEFYNVDQRCKFSQGTKELYLCETWYNLCNVYSHSHTSMSELRRGWIAWWNGFKFNRNRRLESTCDWDQPSGSLICSECTSSMSLLFTQLHQVSLWRVHDTKLGHICELSVQESLGDLETPQMIGGRDPSWLELRYWRASLLESLFVKVKHSLDKNKNTTSICTLQQQGC